METPEEKAVEHDRISNLMTKEVGRADEDSYIQNCLDLIEKLRHEIRRRPISISIKFPDPTIVPSGDIMDSLIEDGENEATLVASGYIPQQIGKIEITMDDGCRSYKFFVSSMDVYFLGKLDSTQMKFHSD